MNRIRTTFAAPVLALSLAGGILVAPAALGPAAPAAVSAAAQAAPAPQRDVLGEKLIVCPSGKHLVGSTCVKKQIKVPKQSYGAYFAAAMGALWLSFRAGAR